MHWYKRDISAALNGMVELSLEQRGLYNAILDLIYDHDGALKDDDRRIARSIRVHHHQYRKIKAELISAGKIWIEAGYVLAKRVETTLAEANAFAVEQSQRSKRRWQRGHNSDTFTGGVKSELLGGYQGTFLNDFNGASMPSTTTKKRKKEREASSNVEVRASSSLERLVRDKGWVTKPD